MSKILQLFLHNYVLFHLANFLFLSTGIADISFQSLIQKLIRGGAKVNEYLWKSWGREPCVHVHKHMYIRGVCGYSSCTAHPLTQACPTMPYISLVATYVHKNSWRIMNYFSFHLLSDILQPQSERDHRWGSVCIGWSFASEPESSEAIVSNATCVVVLERCTLRL